MLTLIKRKLNVSITIRKIRFQNITRKKESYFIMIKGSILQDDITTLNIYAPNNKTSVHMKQRLKKMQGKIDKCTIIVGDFNTSLSTTDKLIKQKITI